MTEEEESAAAAWRDFLATNFDALLEGMPKRAPGFGKDLPECPVLAMFELFPVTKLN